MYIYIYIYYSATEEILGLFLIGNTLNAITCLLDAEDNERFSSAVASVWLENASATNPITPVS